MRFDTVEYIHRVNGTPLYYNGLTPFLDYHRYHPVPNLFVDLQGHSLPETSPEASPPYTQNDVLMSKITPQNSPLTLTPPISPLPVIEQQTRRGSVIMKVENCQIIPAQEGNESQLINIEHVCRWVGCYR